jgi:hypothetical protein
MKTYDQLSEAEKQKIEYEAKAKTNARNDDLSAWGCAGVILSILGLLLYTLITTLF